MTDREPLNQMEAMTQSRYFTAIWGDHEFTNWRDENCSWKLGCYIGDWSWLLTRRYHGPDVIRLFSDLSVNSYATFDVDACKHVVYCNADGKVIHDGVLEREAVDSIIQFGRGCEYVDHVLAQGGYDVRSEPLQWFKYQVSGPTSVEVLEAVATAGDLRQTPFMHRARIEIAGHAVWAMRTGMAGEQGFELQGDYAHAGDVYDAVLAAGSEHGIRRLGGRVAMINHLEACFPTVCTDYLPAIFGSDMEGYLRHLQARTPNLLSIQFQRGGSMRDDGVEAYYRSPIELGWGRSVKVDHDFIGRGALEAEAASPRRKIFTLEWNSDDVVAVYASLFDSAEPYPYMELPREPTEIMYCDTVLRGDAAIGASTSRGYSYWFRRMLSLAVLDVERAAVGDEVEVLHGDPGTRQMRVRATIAPAPYKADRRRDPGGTPG